jgi:hypothetical protein
MIACLNERTLRIFATSSPESTITAVKIVLAKPLGPVRLTVIPLRQKITPAIDAEGRDYEITKSLSHGHTGG